MSHNLGTCFVWKLGPEDTSVFDHHQTFSAHKTYVLKALFSPNSRLLATTSADKSVKLWNVNKDGTMEMARSLKGHERWVWDCVFSADSAYIVTASSDQTARLWDVAHGETIRQYTGHLKAVVCVALQDQ
jgi:target of rapamycin complex subunit LST8